MLFVFYWLIFSIAFLFLPSSVYAEDILRRILEQPTVLVHSRRQTRCSGGGLALVRLWLVTLRGRSRLHAMHAEQILEPKG